MCTAITYKTKDNYFGRTLDLEYSYNETVTVTPQNFKLSFRKCEEINSHFAIIGMANVVDNYPLYYEAANECGLAMAALNFPGNAHYFAETQDKDNIAPFELIPWILAQCKNIADARLFLNKINICNINFSSELPAAPLHWFISDNKSSITVESVKDGLKIHENSIGVLTNNPCFNYHMTHLCDYANLSPYQNEKLFGGAELKPYSKGLGAMGLPGDFSSASRFVRAAFVKLNSVSENKEEESVNQFFHILGSVTQPRGCVKTENGNVITQYTSCINTDKGIYYYTTYENQCISAVNMYNCNLSGTNLYNYPLEEKQIVNWQN